MPELRVDPITGLRAIVAAERGERPGGWREAAGRTAIDAATDPFKEGHEHMTPAEVYAVRPEGGAADSPGWTVRVVPNKFPALGGDGEAAVDPLAGGRGEPDLFAASPAQGAHEVIVNGPEPVSSLLDLGPDGLAAAMAVWQQRMAAHRDAAYVHLIVNEGKAAGASLPHTHAQLYALPFVPALVARERERFAAYHDRTQGRNLAADLLQEEVRHGERIVCVGSDAVALCPFASHVPFHVQLLPRSPRASFEDEGATGAETLHEALRRLAGVIGDVPPFNLWVRTAPPRAPSFGWRIDLLPRLAHPAGLEMGAGVQLCTLAPERAAEQLRASDPEALL